MDSVFFWCAELLRLAAAVFGFAYGARCFFKKGVPLCLQSVTMALGSYSLGSLYHICYTLTNDLPARGFTPAYLGHFGFFAFMLTATYAQMDKIVDDGSKAMRPSRVLALPAAALAMALFLPTAFWSQASVTVKLTCLAIWLFGAASIYFHVKHAIIPDLDFGFIKAIRPYNRAAACLGFAELMYLTAWNMGAPLWMLLTSALFAVLTVVMMIFAGKGVKRWTI